ncbi:MAG TPA: four-carbon acid sugar kinase family protein [Verrucomicrobiota bacterium]|nr:four-carbon acid sugar kinase family protein [Verrucomicrobiota bacterium]HPU57201.1 four-carbon acid sugar kinase family protein [Verrucomicrobiota bacterium]
MIGVIADDLSGAAEIGAVGLRHGLRCEILSNPGKAELMEWLPGRKARRGGTAAELICIDTDSRSCAPAEAARRAGVAAQALRQAGARWIYKKVDSVLRGRIVPEIEGIMAELGLNRALLVAANPGRRRVIRNGRYYVGGKLISRTEFARDPEYPRASPLVVELLGRSAASALTVCRVGDRLPSSGVIVGEASRPSDLGRWTACRRSRLLLAGAAEFFAALLAATGHRTADNAGVEALETSGCELFVCGTTSRASRDFVKASHSARVPVISLPSELAWGAEFSAVAMKAVARRAVSMLRNRQRVILNVGLPRVRGTIVRTLTLHLVEVAAQVLAEAPAGRVYAEGGATAAALVRRMGWRRMRVLREVAPGVATLGVECNRSILLTIKPGSYVWPDEIREAPASGERAAA